LIESALVQDEDAAARALGEFAIDSTVPPWVSPILRTVDHVCPAYAHP